MTGSTITRQARSASGRSTNARWFGAYTRTFSDTGAWQDEKSLIIDSARAPCLRITVAGVLPDRSAGFPAIALLTRKLTPGKPNIVQVAGPVFVNVSRANSCPADAEPRKAAIFKWLLVQAGNAGGGAGSAVFDRAGVVDFAAVLDGALRLAALVGALGSVAPAAVVGADEGLAPPEEVHPASAISPISATAAPSARATPLPPSVNGRCAGLSSTAGCASE